jgi:hypothetical protein
MTKRQEPRNDIWYAFASGEAGWGTNVNTNFLNIGLFSHIAAINFSTTIPPVSPSLGDSYIVGDGATGDWDTEDGNLAVWAYEVTGTTQMWLFLEPKAGWTAFNSDDNKLYAHNGTQWSDDGFQYIFTP